MSDGQMQTRIRVHFLAYFSRIELKNIISYILLVEILKFVREGTIVSIAPTPAYLRDSPPVDPKLSLPHPIRSSSDIIILPRRWGSFAGVRHRTK